MTSDCTSPALRADEPLVITKPLTVVWPAELDATAIELYDGSLATIVNVWLAGS